MSEPAPFDVDAIARLRRFGGDKLVFEMIDLFSAALPGRLTAARDALAAGNADGARGAFHALKSSAGQLGAVRVQALCEQGEGLARSGDVAAAAALMPALDDAARAMAGWLMEIRKGNG